MLSVIQHDFRLTKPLLYGLRAGAGVGIGVAACSLMTPLVSPALFLPAVLSAWLAWSFSCARLTLGRKEGLYWSGFYSRHFWRLGGSATLGDRFSPVWVADSRDGQVSLLAFWLLGPKAKLAFQHWQQPGS